MKKLFPIIASLSAASIICAGFSIALTNKYQFHTANAENYQIEFTSENVDDFEYDYDNTFAYLSLTRKTPLGNDFSPYDLGEIYGGGGVTVKQNSKIFTIEDQYAGGYFSIVFKFDLNIATFDHITFLGSFTTGYSDPSTVSFVTFNEIDSEGYVTAYLEQIRSASVTQINVAYSC